MNSLLRLIPLLFLPILAQAQVPIKEVTIDGNISVVNIEKCYAVVPQSDGTALLLVDGGRSIDLDDLYMTFIADNCGTFIESSVTNWTFPAGYSTLGISSSWIDKVVPITGGSKVLMRDPKVSFTTTNPPNYFQAQMFADLCGAGGSGGSTNLSYIAAPSQGTVTSSTGTDAVLPVVDNTNAGLATTDMFEQSQFITVTQAVNLDVMESVSHVETTVNEQVNGVDLSLNVQELSVDLNIPELPLVVPDNLDEIYIHDVSSNSIGKTTIGSIGGGGSTTHGSVNSTIDVTEPTSGNFNYELPSPLVNGVQDFTKFGLTSESGFLRLDIKSNELIEGSRVLYSTGGDEMLGSDTIDYPTDFWFTPTNGISGLNPLNIVYINPAGEWQPAQRPNSPAQFVVAETRGGDVRLVSHGKITIVSGSPDGPRWTDDSAGLTSISKQSDTTQYVMTKAGNDFIVNIEPEFVIGGAGASIPVANNGIGLQSNNYRLGNTFMVSQPETFTSDRKINIGLNSLYIGRDLDTNFVVFDGDRFRMAIGDEVLPTGGLLQLFPNAGNAKPLVVRDVNNTFDQLEFDFAGGTPLIRWRNSAPSQMTIGYNAGVGGWAIRPNATQFYFNENQGGPGSFPIWNFQSTWDKSPGSLGGSLDRRLVAITETGTYGANTIGDYSPFSIQGTYTNNSLFGQTITLLNIAPSISGSASESTTSLRISTTAGVAIDQESTLTENSLMGNTGIGIVASSVTEKLHVDGNVRVTGSYLDSSNNAGLSGQFLTSTGTGTAWATSADCSETIAQTGHGHIPGDAVYWDGDSYEDIAGNFASVNVPSGIVVSVVDANNFIIATCSFYPSNFGLVDGIYYATDAGLSTTPSNPEMPVLQVNGGASIINPFLTFSTDPFFTITTTNGANPISDGETFVLHSDSVIVATSNIGGVAVIDVGTAIERLQNGSEYIIADGTPDNVVPTAEQFTVVVNTSTNAETQNLPNPAILYENVIVTVKQIESVTNAVTVSTVGGTSVIYDGGTTSATSAIPTSGGSKSYQCINIGGTYHWVVI